MKPKHVHTCEAMNKLIEDDDELLEFLEDKPKWYEIDNKQNNDNSEVLNYLYEPNSMILKSGAFGLICDRHDVKKLNSNSHLYTSKKLIDFPGRAFKVESVVNYSKRNLKDLNISKANITTRNFPMDVKDIRKKSKILDGGKDYLFFTTNHVDKQIIIKTKKTH